MRTNGWSALLVLLTGMMLAAGVTSPARAQGTLEQVSFHSDALGQERTFEIYLPAGYDPQGPRRYPVVYFLHGLGASPETYSSGLAVGLDMLIAMRTISPVIMVIPDGHAAPYAGSFFTSSTLYGDIETYFVTDLVNYVDTHYATDASRQGRALVGHSMGGYGAMRLAFKYPERFRAAVAHSGPLDLSRVSAMIPALLQEYDEPPYEYHAAAGFFSGALFSMAGAFSPAPPGVDPPVQLPMDSQGELVPAVLERWMDHNPVGFARQLAARGIDVELFFDCGTRDELGLYDWNVSFADSLTRIGLPFEFQSYDGGHSDKIIDRLLVSIQWVDARFATPIDSPTAVTAAAGVQPAEFQLEPSYPNPFNAETVIPFTLPRDKVVRLEIFSALGHRVAVLVNERLPAGRHTISWRAADLASGVYFSRLEADSRVDTRPLLLLR